MARVLRTNQQMYVRILDNTGDPITCNNPLITTTPLCDKIQFYANGQLSGGSLRLYGSTNHAISDYYPHYSRAGATALTISSTSATDTAAGAGCRSVRVKGLSSSWALQEEVVELNGTTAVNLVKTYSRLLDINVETTGSDGKPSGTIDIEDGSSNVWIRLDSSFGGANEGSRNGSHFSVPAGYRALLYFFQVNHPVAGDFCIRYRPNSNITSPPFGGCFKTAYFTDFQGDLEVALVNPMVFDAYTDIQFTAYMDSAAYCRIHCAFMLQNISGLT